MPTDQVGSACISVPDRSYHERIQETFMASWQKGGLGVLAGGCFVCFLRLPLFLAAAAAADAGGGGGGWA